MDPRLSKLIDGYQRRVADAVAMLEHSGVPRPASSLAWVIIAIPQSGTLPDGFDYFKHGYGCRIRGPEWSVDFDFGREGEINGFDAWRLYDFARPRLSEYGFDTENEIKASVDGAAAAGQLRFSGSLLYYVKAAGPQAS